MTASDRFVRSPRGAELKGQPRMPRPKESRPPVKRAARLIVFSLTIAALGGLAWHATHRVHARKPARDRFPITAVRRADLFPTLKAGGQLQSARRTIIECRLENLSAGVQGQKLYAGGSSVLLKIIPEGTAVKKGDVLAVLDSSEYEELLRVQRINVQRAEADKLQADLDHEIARLALAEYRDGTLKEQDEDFRRRVALARADFNQASDRLTWSRSMKAKGYVSTSVVTTDEYTAAQLELKLQQEEGAFEVFRKYTGPRTLRELEGNIIAARTTLDYQTLRVNRHHDRLRILEQQVANCTIRAPHDGYVVYAHDKRHDIMIEEGMPVREGQDLIYLPDLNTMEVVAMINESIIPEIRKGMTAKIQVEGLPDRVLRGRVRKVGQIAVSNWRTDVNYYEGFVTIEGAIPGLRPGMTSQVEIDLPLRDDVLTVPSESVANDDGQDVCYVVRGDELERRPVKLGRVTQNLTEVTAGLREGDQVVLDPDPEELSEDVENPGPVASSLSESSPSESAPEPGPSDVAAR